MLKNLSHMLLVNFACFALSAHAEPPAATSVENGATTSTAQTPSNVKPSSEKPDGWQVFIPPAGDFQILMPANVQRKVDNQPGNSSTQYFQRADGVDLVVTDGTYIAGSDIALQSFYLGAVDKIEQQLNKTNRSLVTKEVDAIDGKGWHGKQVIFKTDDKILAMVRILFSSTDEVGYKLLATAGTENPKVKTFFDSFEVDPAIASKAHLSSTSSSTVRNFMSVVWPVSLFILTAIVISLIVAAFRKREK